MTRIAAVLAGTVAAAVLLGAGVGLVRVAAYRATHGGDWALIRYDGLGYVDSVLVTGMSRERCEWLRNKLRAAPGSELRCESMPR